jgi:rhodanese-related sulfurtransferase
VALFLQEQGYRARALTGGYDGWQLGNRYSEE